MRVRNLVFCLFVFALAAFSQSMGTITGTIEDPAGAVVPNAPVEVKNMDTGAVYRAGASSTGNFTIPVPVGKYELSVTVTGFKKFVRQNLEVTIATDTRQDVNLTVGAITDVITVNESAPLLKTESGELSHVVSINAANDLPVLTIGATANGIRDPLQVMNLLPGVQFQADNIVRVNGLPSNSEAIRIEGQDATNGIWRQSASMVESGTDAIQEVSIQTSNFAAEYGQAAGGYFNFTMKSGTNQFHGSAYDYLKNEALNAGLPYTDAGLTNSLKDGQHVRNRLRQNDYGFTIGGPIRIPKVYNGQNRSFFFFNFEQYRQATNNSTSVLTVPTTAYQQGNFAAATPICAAVSASCPAVGGPTYLTQSGVIAKDPLGRTVLQNGIYDPTTAQQTAGGIVTNPFPNSQIPATRFDPVSVAVQKLLPQPTNGNQINNYQVPLYTNFTHTSNPSVKIDQSLSSTIKLSGYFSELLQNSPNNNGLTLGGSQATSYAITGVAPTNNINRTTRINYDQTLKPTLLLHFGIGYLWLYDPGLTPAYNQSQIGLSGFYANLFPSIAGINNTTTGGYSGTLGPGSYSAQKQYDEKTTANANLTWVKGNHTFKFGGELIIDGQNYQTQARGNGNFGFSVAETSDPYQNSTNPALNSTSGFGYASFLLGAVDNLTIAPPADMRLGNHAVSFFAQDSWKVTRKLTLDYGLRYDYQTYLKEQYGRMQDADFTMLNTLVGRPGTVIYEGNGPGQCNCQFSHNYPWAFGPRLGVAYQINPKTVFRGGAGLQYGTASNDSELLLSIEDFYTFNAPGYGIQESQLSQGNPYAAGNAFGNPTLHWPNFDPNKYPTRGVCPGTSNQTCYTPQNPFISLDPSARPPRIFTYSLGIQRELNRNLVLEVSYVGNRGAWFTAPGLSVVNENALNSTDLANFGLNINNAADRSLLTSTLNSPTAIQRGFGNPAYPGFPTNQTVIQSLRPHPQWIDVPPFLGPPLGRTWYDSLQVKLTKRFSHGLDAQGSYTYQKELSMGANSDTAFLTSGPTVVNDVYNRDTNKQLSPFSRPNQLVISGTYTVPKPSFVGNKIVQNVIKDWQLGTVLKYQSGALIQVPNSLNNVFSQLGRTGGAFFAGGNTFWNLPNGNQNFFLVDPNSHFDPTKQLVLNPATWTDTPAGQFSSSAAFYNNYRWQRQPAEALSFARNFHMGHEGKYNLQVRMEFQNVFNRHFFSAPNGALNPSNPSTATVNTAAFVQGGPAAGALSNGFGYLGYLNGAGDTPRSGQAVARFTF
jgi:hypothetical protein